MSCSFGFSGLNSACFSHPSRAYFISHLVILTYLISILYYLLTIKRYQTIICVISLPLNFNLTVLIKHSRDSSRVKYAQRFGDIFRLHHQGMIASRLSWALMPFRLVNFFPMLRRNIEPLPSRFSGQIQSLVFLTVRRGILRFSETLVATSLHGVTSQRLGC